MIFVAAGDPHTAQPPGGSQGSLNGIQKLLVVTTFTQFHQGLSATGPGLLAQVTFLVCECEREKSGEGRAPMFFISMKT